jgi:lysine 2,3-aminomutase
MKAWQKDLKEALRTREDFEVFFKQDFPNLSYPLFLPRPFAEKVKKSKALKLQFLPSDKESVGDGLYDPIGDQKHQVAPGFIHRYKNRALFTPTSMCPVLCRYCFRKNELSFEREFFRIDLNKISSYLWEHQEINEIIFTGGDPLVLSDEKLKEYLDFFSEFPQIKFIRLHTRVPVTLPHRIDHELLKLLDFYRQRFLFLQIVCHINHKDEFTPELKMIPGSLVQSVLLKDINNSIQDLSDLIENCLEYKLRPYLLHHPDQVKGGEHFRIPLGEGRKLYGQLRRVFPGWAIPQYVIDLPNGGGKIQAFNPESFEYSGKIMNQFGELLELNDL